MSRLNALLKTIFFCFLISSNLFATDKPNILWIITDDQRMDSNGIFNLTTTGIKESPLGYVESPNIDALADEGVFFTNTYCNSPACAPSRASIITGKYPHHSGIYGFEQTHNRVDIFTPTMPEVLGQQGYETSMFGKGGYYIFEWGPGLTWNDLGFYNLKIDFKNDLRNHGFTDWYNRAVWGNGSKVGTQAEFYYPDGTNKKFFIERTDGELTQEDLDTKAFVDNDLDLLYSYTRENTNLIIGGVSPMPKDKTIDGRILEEFINYLENQDNSYQSLSGRSLQGANSSAPQFLSLSFSLPHTPVLPPEEFRARFKDKVYQIPEFDRSEVDKLPPQLQAVYEKMKIDGLTYEEKQQAIRDYYAFCAYGDYLIGKGIDAFKKYSQENGQEYVIIYVSGDHGWHLGEQGIEAKFAPWKYSNHGCAIVVSSDKTKFPAGEVYSGFVEYVDLMPTVLSTAGIDVSAENYNHLDGYDWAEVLQDPSKKREYVLGEINQVAGPRAFIRTESFAFSMKTRHHWGRPGKHYPPNENIRWGLDAPRDEVDMALYDLRIDPMERNNIANAQEYIELADWFRQKLGNIILGDGRVEVDWWQENVYDISNFAPGADDKKIDIPQHKVPEVAYVLIEEERVKMEISATYQLTFETSSEDQIISWSSNNPEVATVSEEGLVTTHSEGNAGIIATLKNGTSDICVIYADGEVEIPLSIKKKIELNHPFPNPFQGSLSIKDIGMDWSMIRVYDPHGRIFDTIEKSDLNQKIGQQWEPGTYILEFIKGDLQLSYKVIKQ